MCSYVPAVECTAFDINTNLTNVVVDYTGYLAGDTARVSCPSGYILDGPATAVCGLEGSWGSTLPNCTGGCYSLVNIGLVRII